MLFLSSYMTVMFQAASAVSCISRGVLRSQERNLLGSSYNLLIHSLKSELRGYNAASRLKKQTIERGNTSLSNGALYIDWSIIQTLLNLSITIIFIFIL